MIGLAATAYVVSIGTLEALANIWSWLAAIAAFGFGLRYGRLWLWALAGFCVSYTSLLLPANIPSPSDYVGIAGASGVLIALTFKIWAMSFALRTFLTTDLTGQRNAQN